MSLMETPRRAWLLTLTLLGALILPSNALAQEPDADGDGAEQVPGQVDTEAEAEIEAAEAEIEESLHGSYEWKFAIGGGPEFGLFFTQLDRWNNELLGPNDVATFDTDVVLNLDLSLEIYPIDILRLAIFGGLQGSATDSPSISALYLGIEPAAAFRSGRWELAVGSGVGLGSLDMTIDSGESAHAGLVVLRPFLEARTYATDFMAAYARLGFNYWLTYDVELDDLQPTNQGSVFQDGTSNLNEGGVYLALGLRFGYYPEPIKIVPDTDDDGLRDDVDECVEEPEDVDGFEDEDGCPDPDNDGDGVLDDADKCPTEIEDVDGFEDEDGCPDPDNDGDGILDVDDTCPNEAGLPEKQGCPERDKDGDGILDEVDQCPDEPEDMDGFEDTDGCPDPDNDGDGILDVNDQCPNEPELMNGIEDEDGCPESDRDNDGIIDAKDQCPDEPETYNGNKDEDGCPDGKQTVVVTETEIRILEKVFFDTGKSTIQRRSYPLLDTVAAVLTQTPRLTGVRVEGHTDDVGDDASNMTLSKDRAAAVRQYLLDKGVAAARLESEGYGESKPLCDEMPELLQNERKNKSAINECRAQNRRVGFKITSVNNQAIDASEAATIRERTVTEEPVPGTTAPETTAPETQEEN